MKSRYGCTAVTSEVTFPILTLCLSYTLMYAVMRTIVCKVTISSMTSDKRLGLAEFK